MPNYLVQLPASNTVGNQVLAAKSMVIFAADAAGARRAAEGRMDGDGNTQWSNSAVATVTELVVGLNLADAGSDLGWTAYARITGGAAQTVDPIIAQVTGKTKDQAQGILGKTRLHIGAFAINSGGTATYVIDDILTAIGGTFTRAATARVITVSTGVITAVEMVDPGEYTVLPSMVANAVSGGGGTVATMDLTQATVNGYEALIGQLVTELAAFADLTTSVDLSEGAAGARLLTLATIANDIGDAAIEVEFRHNGTVETVLASTIVDEGIAGAVLTMAIPAAPLAPPRVHVFQSLPL